MTDPVPPPRLLPALVELNLWELISNAGLRWSIRTLVVVVSAVTVAAAVFVMATGAAMVWVLSTQGLLDDAMTLVLTVGLMLSLGAGISQASASLMRLSPLTRPTTRTAMLRAWHIPPNLYALVWAGAAKIPASIVIACLSTGIGGAYVIVSGQAPMLVLPSLAALALNSALVPMAVDLLVATSRRGQRRVEPRSTPGWALAGLCLGVALVTAYLALWSTGSDNAGLLAACVGTLATAVVAVTIVLETTRQPRVDHLYRESTRTVARRLRIVWLERAAPEQLLLLHHLRRSRSYLAPVKLALLTALGLLVVSIASTVGLDLATLTSSHRGSLALTGVFATLSMIGAETAMSIWPTRQLTARLENAATPEREGRASAAVASCYVMLGAPLAIVLCVAALALRPELWAFGLLTPLASVAAAVLLHCVSTPAVQPGGLEVLDVVTATALAAVSYIPVALVAFTDRAADVLLLSYTATLMVGASVCLGRLRFVRQSSSRASSSGTAQRAR